MQSKKRNLPLHYNFNLFLCILKEILCVLMSQITCIVVVNLRNDVSTDQFLTRWRSWSHLKLICNS